MKQVKGYVFIPESRDYAVRIVFGKSPKGIKGVPEPFEERLNPYRTGEEAIEGAKRCFKNYEYVEKSEIYSLALRYAETNEEFHEFEKESNLVVMLLLEEDDLSLWPRNCLIGPIIEGKTSLAPIPGAKLRDNGYELFTQKEKRTAFERVLDCHHEVQRQGQLPCTIGQLKMTRLGQIISRNKH